MYPEGKIKFWNPHQAVRCLRSDVYCERWILVLGTMLEPFRWRGQMREKGLNCFYFSSPLGESICAPWCSYREAGKWRALQGRHAFPVCLFVMLTQDIESTSICTANTPLIHWIRSNHKPDRQAPHVLGRKCVSQVRSEFQLKPWKCSELSGEAVSNSFLPVCESLCWK